MPIYYPSATYAPRSPIMTGNIGGYGTEYLADVKTAIRPTDTGDIRFSEFYSSDPHPQGTFPNIPASGQIEFNAYPNGFNLRPTPRSIQITAPAIYRTSFSLRYIRCRWFNTGNCGDLLFKLFDGFKTSLAFSDLPAEATGWQSGRDFPNKPARQIYTMVMLRVNDSRNLTNYPNGGTQTAFFWRRRAFYAF